MTLLNFTSTTVSGFLETDYDQLVGLFENGTYSVSYFDTAELKINGVAVTATAAELNYVSGITSSIQTQLDSKLNDSGDTGTGSYNFGEADSFEIPNSATPIVDTDGQIAMDTSVVDFSHGVLKYYGGEEMGVISMPIAQFTSPTDGYVVAYNATNDEFELVAQSGGSGGAAATFERTFTGNVSTGSLIPISIPDELAGLDIKEVRLSVTALPAGQALKVDVRKSGTATTDSIFTSDTEIEIPTTQTATNGLYMTGCNTSGSTVGTAGTTIDSAMDTLSADDVLFIYVTQVGSTVAGADLVVTISVA